MEGVGLTNLTALYHRMIRRFSVANNEIKLVRDFLAMCLHCQPHTLGIESTFSKCIYSTASHDLKRIRTVRLEVRETYKRTQYSLCS